MIANLPHSLRTVFVAAAVAASAGPPVLAARVGVDSAVNPEATGTPPGGAPQRIVLGQDILFNERIATTASGQTQILFVDQSTLTVGPNSNMVIDQFVFDPNAGTGKLAASLTKGVFRFVGGALSKGDNAVTFRTPTATIGIRGGIMLVDVDPDCGAAPANPTCTALQVVFAYGKGVTVTGLDGLTQTITRPGFQVTIARTGAAPSAPGPAPKAAIGNFLARLDGRSGEHGGARTIPTDVVVEKGTAAVIASTAPTVQVSQTQAPSVANTILSAGLNIQNAQAGGAIIHATPIQQPMPPPKNTCPPDCPPVTIHNIAGAYTDTAGQGTAAGFPGPLQTYASSNVVNGQATITGSFGTVSFPLVVGSGFLSPSGTGTSSPLGPVTGTTFLTSDETFFYADLTPVNDPSQREFVYGGLPVNSALFQTASGTSQVLAFTVQPDAALLSQIPFIRQGTGGSLDNASISPLVFATPAGSPFVSGSGSTKALQASLAISGSGANQQSVIVVLVGNVIANSFNLPSLNGVVHGSFLGNSTLLPTRINSFYATPADANGNAFYGGSGISGFVLSSGALGGTATEINTANGTASGYQFLQPATATGVPGAAIGPQSTRNIAGWFGGIMTKGASSGSGPFSYAVTGGTAIGTNAADLKIAATLKGGDPFTSTTSGINPNDGMVLQFGSLQPGLTQARQAFIDDNLFAALESPRTNSKVGGVTVPFDGSNPSLYLVTASAVQNALLPNGLCACQFLQWGYWGGEIDTPAGNDNPARVDIAHINSWVAGPLTQDIATLKAMGATGSYSGNLFGTVDNHGDKYLASGALGAFYNFGTQRGTFAVSNFDGHSFTATGSGSGANYSFGIVPGSGLTGRFNGSFYGPGAIETGGNFAFRTIAGTPYFASGVYGARMIGP